MTVRILVRHCFASDASKSKSRPPGFDRVVLHERLLQSLQTEDALSYQLIMMVDDAAGVGPHFVENADLRAAYASVGVAYDVVRMSGGSEKAAFLNCLNYAKDAGWPFNDVVVFLEDDYAVAQSWLGLVTEGLTFGAYVTLYDHPDKYSKFTYPDLVSKLYMGELAHWRTTPSTTNSYACGVRTLLEDLNTHKSYSVGQGVTMDHMKFLQLWHLGRSLVSCIPGAWSHEETGMQCSKWF